MKIIYIHPHPTPHQYYSSNGKPPVCWDTPDGGWIGIWGYDWANLLGNNVLAHTPVQDFEIWQPEPRADKVYSHQFDNGLVHRLFPASYTKRVLGNSKLNAPAMVEHLEKVPDKDGMIIQTEVSALVNGLVKALPDPRLMGILHGTIRLPFEEIFKLRRNVLRYFHLLDEHFTIKQLLRRYRMITYQNDTNLEAFRGMYGGCLEKITMGVDFERFRKLDKMACRKDLGLPEDKKIILSVGRLNPLKQNDKIIQILNRLEEKHDFLLLVIGNESVPGYADHLQKLAAPLRKAGKVRFEGFKDPKELVKYYNAADLFLMSSWSEGGSVATMEAAACQVPVLSTRTGYCSELLEAEGKGLLVGIRDFKQWQRSLDDFLSGRLSIEALGHDVAYDHFSWPSVAKRFYRAYQKVESIEC